jgi:hypothetical protein
VVLAFLASFTIFATYRGKGRRLLILIIFITALIPTAYLTFTYNQIIVRTAPPEYAESYLLTLPPLTDILYASCGIPLALIPVLAFGNSLIQARRRRDKILTYRATMMFTALILNEIAYLLFVFFTGIILFATLLSWIPIELFLLFAVFRITSPPQPET